MSFANKIAALSRVSAFRYPKPNDEVANIFEDWREKLYQTGESNKFRLKGYSKAAKAIAALSEPAYEILDRGDKIPGVGSKTITKLKELFSTGKISDYEAIKQLAPSRQQFSELLRVEGIGEKMALRLYRSGIGTIDELQRALDSGKLEKIVSPRFAAKIKISLQLLVDPKRVPMEKVIKTAKPVIEAIKPFVRKIELVGSARRGKPDAHDADILIVPGNRSAMEEALAPFEEFLIQKGKAIYRFKVGGLLIDISLCPADEWGSTLLYRTGSKDFNIKMRYMLKAVGWKLNEHGLYDEKGSLRAKRTEKDIFDVLGMRFVPPKDRESGKMNKYFPDSFDYLLRA